MQQVSGLVRLNFGCGLICPPGWINIDGSIKTLFVKMPRPVMNMAFPLTKAGAGFSRELQQETVNGEGIEPIPNFADDLGEPEAAEVAVPSDKAQVCRQSDARRGPLGLGVHGEMDRVSGR